MKPQVIVRVNVAEMLIGDFRKSVLLEKLSTKTPDVILDGKGSIVISSEEGDEDLNDEKLLQEMGIVDGCILKVDDFQDNNQITLVIVNDENQDGKSFEVTIDAEAEKKASSGEKISREEEQEEPAAKKARIDEPEEPKKEENNVPGSSKQTMEDSDDDLEIVESDDETQAPATTSGVKRKQAPEEEEPVEKRKKVVEPSTIIEDDEDVILVE